MHYYKRNIGDYAKKAGRLSMLEHGAYTLLMDAIYDRETFPTLEEALDWAWARDEAEVAAVKFVLSKFFTLEDGRYVQNRIQDELVDYKAKAETNARIAKQREEKRKSKNEASRTVNEPCEEKHESSPNHKPLTNNHKPLTNNHKPITSNQYKYTFDLNVVNTNLKMAGRHEVDQKYIDDLQSQFELYYADQQMVENKALVKFVQWVMRKQDLEKQNATKPKIQTSQERTANEHDRWRQAEKQTFGERDVTPKKLLQIEGVGHA